MDNRDSEQLNIQVRNQIIQEKVLIKSSEISTTLFQSLLINFSTALIIQLLSIIPSSYSLRTLLPTIFLVLTTISVLILILLKKQPTLKTYLLLIAFLIGLIIGI